MDTIEIEVLIGGGADVSHVCPSDPHKNLPGRKRALLELKKQAEVQCLAGRLVALTSGVVGSPR